jgi:hypothetical protein
MLLHAEMPFVDSLDHIERETRLIEAAARKSRADVMKISASYAAHEARMLALHAMQAPVTPPVDKVPPAVPAKAVLPSDTQVRSKRVTYKWPWRKIISFSAAVLIAMAAMVNSL